MIYNLSIQATTNDYGLDGSLIPRSFKGYCLSDKIYRERFRTCSCDTHCSWDLCRSFTPPTNCLLGTDSVWKLDNVKNAWVAQRLGGNTLIFAINLLLALSILEITHGYIYVPWYVFKHWKEMKRYHPVLYRQELLLRCHLHLQSMQIGMKIRIMDKHKSWKVDFVEKRRFVSLLKW